MNPEEFKRLLKEFAPTQQITEADVIPVGPDGNEITDKKVIANLNLAVKSVDASLRPKLVQILEDPDAASALKNPAQRAALIGAIAIAFGMTEKEFSQIISKIKGMLKTTETPAPDDQA
jgi:hypothetical protein